MESYRQEKDLLFSFHSFINFCCLNYFLWVVFMGFLGVTHASSYLFNIFPWILTYLFYLLIHFLYIIHIILHLLTPFIFCLLFSLQYLLLFIIHLIFLGHFVWSAFMNSLSSFSTLLIFLQLRYQSKETKQTRDLGILQISFKG